MKKYIDVVFDREGRPLSGIMVRVKTAGTSADAVIYSDNIGTVKTNPMFTDSNGEFSFYAADGRYDIALSGTGMTARTISDVVIEDGIAELSAPGGAALVGYLPEGTGAVATTVQSKLRESVSVLDFGADGTNSTGNDAVFVSASNVGGIVYVPKPTTKYKFGATTFPKKSAFLLDPSATWDSLTDGGKLNILRGGRPEWSDGQNIWRFTDRVFVGDAAAFLSGQGNTAPGTSWFGDTTNYAGYLGLNGKVVVSSTDSYDDVPYGITVGVRTSDTNQEAIGLGIHIVTDKSDVYSPGWGMIVEAQREANGAIYGIEISAKNKSNDQTMTPNTQTVGVFGVWLAAGGDDAFGGAPANPSTAAMVILKNSSTWNSGIVFMKDAITSGGAISMSSQAVGTSHRVDWYNAADKRVFSIYSKATISDLVRVEQNDYGLSLLKNNYETHRFTAAAAPGTGLSFYAGDTYPTIGVFGTATNIDLALAGNGTGLVRFGTYTATGDAAINGFVLIKDAAGNQRKLATIA